MSTSDLQHLTGMLGNRDAHQRRQAARDLGHSGPEAGVFLEDALEDPDWRVRAEAALALDRLRSFPARHALARAASRDEVGYVREAARFALTRLKAGRP